MMTLPRLITGFFSLLLTQVTQEVFACAVCGFGEGESRDAFIFTTGIMTFVPLIFIASVLIYMRRRFLKLKSLQEVPE